MRPSLGHFTLVHIHNKFEEDLLNSTYADSGRICFEQRGMLHQNCQQFGPNKTSKYLNKMLKDASFLLIKSKDLVYFYYISLYIAHIDLVCFSNLEIHQRSYKAILIIRISNKLMLDKPFQSYSTFSVYWLFVL